MDLGIDKRKLAALEARGLEIAADPVLLRASITALLLVIGVVVIERPEIARLESARLRQAEAQVRADTSDDLRLLERQVKNYEPHLGPNAELVDWGNYILEKLEESGATLRAMEPKRTVTSGRFKVVDFDMTAQGSFEQLTDFVDRLERGERVVRLDRVYIQRMRATINLECTIKGLVKVPKTRVPEAQPTHASEAQPTRGSEAQPTRGSEAQPTRGSEAQPTRGSEAQPTRGSEAQPTRVPDAQPTHAPEEPPHG